MHLSTVERRLSEVMEHAGDTIGYYLIGDPHFGATILEVMQPVIREVALMVGDCFNAAAVMADSTQPMES